jgi:hypothetical protein
MGGGKMAISKKVTERIIAQLKKYRSILMEAKDRDINESDTVVIIADMLADILGYKKYLEITTEFAVRGTYVDLAVKVGNEVRFLIEAKAIDSPLKDIYIKQAIDYGANHGIEWVILSNGINWQIYKIHFKQPIDKSLVYELDVLQANPKDPQLLECLGSLSREGFTQSSMTSFYQQKQVTSKFSLAAVLLSQPLLLTLKRELKKISPTVKIDEDFLKTILQNEVLKREVVDSDEARQALDYIKRISKAYLKAKVKAVKITKDTKQEDPSTYIEIDNVPK